MSDLNAEPDDADTGPLEVAPIEALLGPGERRGRIQRIPQAAWGAVKTVRAAAPGTLYLTVGLQVASAALTGVQLYVVKHLISQLLVIARDHHHSVSGVIPAFVAMVVATVGMGLVGALITEKQALLDELVSLSVFDRIITVASEVELARFEDAEFYDELERATAAGMRRPTEMVNSLMTVLLGVLTSAGVIVFVFSLEPLLVPLVALAALPLLVAALQNSRKTYAFEYAMTTQARERLFLFELFTDREPAKELRVFSATDFLKRRYDALTAERVRRLRPFLRRKTKVSVVAVTAGAVGTGIALGSLTWLLSTNRIGVATAATAAVAMQVLAGRFGAVIGGLGQLVESSMFLQDLRRFLNLNAERASAERARQAPRAAAFESLEVDGVDFTYPRTQRPVLSDVSMEIRRGEVVALVGENGSGKTTLVKLICQLYGATGGTVRWNGTDIGELDAESLRAHITVLFQDFVQYHFSAADNIALGRWQRPRDPEVIEAAARRAGAHDAVAALPNGYETRLGRQFLGGHELSGGQWQRLALARAFYRDADLVVMDEPTAALDPRAEQRLFDQMRELAAGKSVLLISHRFANVRSADRIYVLDHGRIAEVGDHESLMNQDGVYAELFRLQAASYV